MYHYVHHLGSSTLATAALPSRLPRGPHDLPRSAVEGSQRARLKNAVVDLVAEGGWETVTIGALCRAASVSRSTFYEHFESKEACMLAAYDDFAILIAGKVGAALADQGGFERLLEKALHGCFTELERDPKAARAFLVEMEAAGEAAQARRREQAYYIAGLVARAHEQMISGNPSLAPLPDIAYRGLVLGVREIIRDRFAELPDPDLVELVPQIRAWFAATIRGASEL
jgi:AcrR family transcriptional regulator